MGKTLPLKSLLQKVQKKELLQLSELLGWSEAEGSLTKNELAKKAERDIRNLGSTSLGNLVRLGDPITYQELLDELYDELLKEIKELNNELHDELYDELSGGLNEELYEKHKITLHGRRTIQNMEGALALRFLEEIKKNIKKLPRKVQQEVRKGFNKAGYDNPEKLLELITSEKDAANNFFKGLLGGSIVGVLAVIFPVITGMVVFSGLAGLLGLRTDYAKARCAIGYIFLFRQKYNPSAKRIGNSKPITTIKSAPFKIALIGRVSSGKSATINAIFGAKATQVSPIPGSTKDIKGFKVTERIILYDTPGLEDSRSPKYSEKAVTFAKESDVVLFIVNAQQVTDAQKNVFMELKRWKLPYLVILNKLDTIRGSHETFSEQIRKKLGCERKFFLFGALNPRNLDEWDTAGQLLTKINWVVKAQNNRINLNREIMEIMSIGLEGLGAVNDPGEREKLAGIMNRLGIGQN